MAAERTDELLLKRARYGGRSLTGLAILATVFTVLSWIATAIGAPGIIWMAVAFTAVAVAYWSLAQAASRGDERALAIVVVIFTLHFLLSLAGLMAGYLRTGELASGVLIGLIVALLILLAFSRNYSDLTALKKRGLWSNAFPASHPETKRCVVGGVLLACGIVGFYVAAVIPAIGATRIAHSRAEFLELIRTEEKAFLDELANVSRYSSPNVVPELIAKLDALDGKVQSISDAAPSSSNLHSIIATYREALSKWRDGLQSIQSGDRAASASSFRQGDALRVQAFKEFDSRPAGVAFSK